MASVRVQESATPASTATDKSTADRSAGEDRLQLYYAVTSLPLSETKATFRNASPKDKSDLWRTHLALSLDRRPELNEAQKDVIRAAIALASPEYFEIRPKDSAWKTKVRDPLRALEQRIFVVFSLPEAAKIFATLQDSNSPNHRDKCTGAVSLKRINYAPREENQRGACQCSTESDWCPIFGRCTGSACTPTQSGCGTLWKYPCNGASCQ